LAIPLVLQELSRATDDDKEIAGSGFMFEEIRTRRDRFNSSEAEQSLKNLR
jgi:hypothetical protein